MGYQFFCLLVCSIQIVIAIVDFKLARRHHILLDDEAATADILAGISWSITAGWWFYQAMSV